MVSYEVVVNESVSWKASRGGVSTEVHTIVCVRHRLFHMRSAGVMCVGGSSGVGAGFGLHLGSVPSHRMKPHVRQLGGRVGWVIVVVFWLSRVRRDSSSSASVPLEWMAELVCQVASLLLAGRPSFIAVWLSVGMWFMAVWSCLLVCGLVLSCAVSSGEKGLSWGGS